MGNLRLSRTYAGNQESHEPHGWNVAKQILVSTVQAELHSGRLKINKNLKEASILERELQDFQVSITPSGNAPANAHLSNSHSHHLYFGIVSEKFRIQKNKNTRQFIQTAIRRFLGCYDQRLRVYVCSRSANPPFLSTLCICGQLMGIVRFITHWWLVEQSIVKNKNLVEQALAHLAHEGKVVKRVSSDSEAIYSLDPTQR